MWSMSHKVMEIFHQNFYRRVKGLLGQEISDGVRFPTSRYSKICVWAMKKKSKLQWGPQDVGDVRHIYWENPQIENGNCLDRKAIRAVNLSVIWLGLTILIRVQRIHPLHTHTIDSWCGVIGCIFAILGFGLTLVWYFFCNPTFRMEMCTLWHCALEGCNLMFDFIGAHS